MNPTNRTIILHLSLIDGCGPALVSRIIELLGVENLEQMYQFTILDAMHQLRISEKQAHILIKGLRNFTLLEQELTLIEKHQISWITFLDPEYPELLKTIHIPATVIYWRGTLPSAQSIAIVGSRDANAYGKMAIDRLVPQLVAHDWTIISGGARGADTMAHQKTLDHGGKTVAVLGCGLLIRPSPVQNIPLFNSISQTGGAVVSCFPLLMQGAPENFPARNRIIAGLSQGCIVIQAAAKSGARITADYTLSQGREVFAVPGPIDDDLSAGCHELIAQGAKLITNVADVLVEFPAYAYPPSLKLRRTGPSIASGVYPESIEGAGEWASDLHSEPAKKPGKSQQQTLFTPAQLAVPVDPLEAIILATCANPCAVDELLEATGLPLIQLSKLLFDLQIKGMLAQNMAGLWESFETRPRRSSG